MNDIERMISQLERPSPSSELDERIGRLVMDSQWKTERTQQVKILRGSLLILIFATAVGVFFLTGNNSPNSVMQIAPVDTVLKTTSDPTPAHLKVPELQRLLVPASRGRQAADFSTWSFDVALSEPHVNR